MESKNNISRKWILPTILIVLFWMSYLLIICYSKYAIDKAGQFGDSFGALNTLFSGLALAGIIYTIIIQQKEYELTRIELTRSAEAQKSSSQALKDQALLMSLTGLLNGYSSVLNTINYDLDNNVYEINDKRLLRLIELQHAHTNKIDSIIFELEEIKKMAQKA